MAHEAFTGRWAARGAFQRLKTRENAVYESEQVLEEKMCLPRIQIRLRTKRNLCAMRLASKFAIKTRIFSAALKYIYPLNYIANIQLHSFKLTAPSLPSFPPQ